MCYTILHIYSLKNITQKRGIGMQPTRLELHWRYRRLAPRKQKLVRTAQTISLIQMHEKRVFVGFFIVPSHILQLSVEIDCDYFGKTRKRTVSSTKKKKNNLRIPSLGTHMCGTSKFSYYFHMCTSEPCVLCILQDCVVTLRRLVMIVIDCQFDCDCSFVEFVLPCSCNQTCIRTRRVEPFSVIIQ